MAQVDQKLMKQADKLYEQYGRPLEADHWGEYVAISPDGGFVIGQNHLDVLDQALAQFGPGCFLFKIGEKVVGRWR